jgi:mitochondrial chaperone BCS1
MDPLQLIQTTLVGLLQGGQPVANASTSANVTETVISSSSLPPLTFSSIVSLLLSFSALRDWLKLIVIGGVIETSRRLSMRLWASFVESFWLTACFEQNDISYSESTVCFSSHWLDLIFLSYQHGPCTGCLNNQLGVRFDAICSASSILNGFPIGKARIIDISTRSFGLTSPAIAIYGEDPDDNIEGRTLSYLPSFARTYTLWFKGHYVRVTRSQAQEGFYSHKEVLQLEYVRHVVNFSSEKLTERVSILARDHSVLSELLLEAKRVYHEAQAHLISVYVSET